MLIQEPYDDHASINGEFVHEADNDVYLLQTTITGDKTGCCLYTYNLKVNTSLAIAVEVAVIIESH
jgi:hypothetical protein